MNFDAILATLQAVDDGYRVTVTDDWAQGRATFGGLIAGIGNETLRQLVPRDRVLRSLQTTFVGPAPAGIWRINARVLRVGKAVTVASCEIIVDAQVVATVLGVYGGARSSVLKLDMAAPTIVHTNTELIGRAFMDDPPRFTEHFDMRWTQTQRPFSGHPQRHTQTFLRHRDTQVLTESHVVALVDAIPTPGLSALHSPAPASSLVWTLEFLEHRFDYASDAWWHLDTHIDAAADGYIHQTGVLSNPDGRPAALSRQLFTIFG
jgi:acyl-CoA thioesterase